MRVRSRWIAPALLVAVALAVVVALTSSPPEAVPEAPDDEHRSSPPADSPETVGPATSATLSGDIEGRVTRDDQGVAAKLTLRLYSDLDGRRCRTASADPTGSFLFESVPAGNHEITATGEGGIGVRREVALHAGVSRKYVELALPSGELSLSGRAVYADGRPFRGVILAYRGQRPDALVLATGADGRFAATGLEPAQYYTRIRSESLWAEGPGFKLPRDEELRIVVDEGARVLRGRVTSRESGAPVGGAEVSVGGRYPDGRCLSLELRTDAEGEFRVGVPIRNDRIASLVVLAEGFRPWRLDWLPFRDFIEVRLDPSTRLEVSVVSAEGGKPVPSVPVTARYEGVRVRQSDTLLTDERGRVTFSSISGNVVRLSVRGHGWITDHRGIPQERRLLFLEDGEVREVTLSVGRAAHLLGRVTTAAGEPVDGASLGYDTPSVSGGTYLDPGGEFELADLLPGDFRLSAGRRRLRAREVSGTLAPGEVRRVDLPLEAGAWVEVEVGARDTGEAIQGASVGVKGRGRGATDESGRLRIGPFEPGKSGLLVSRYGYLLAREDLELAAGETTSVSLTMDRGLRLRGRVTFADGTPAVGAQVGWYGNGIWEARQITRAGEDGTFELGGLPPGDLEVVASIRDEDDRKHECRRYFPAGTAGAILVLEPEEVAPRRTVELLVTDPAGNPVPRARYEYLLTAADGTVPVQDYDDIVAGWGELEVKAGTAAIHLEVFGARRPSGVALPLGAAKFGPFPGGVERIEVSLPAELVVTGQVLDPSRRGVPRVIVRAGDHGSVWTEPDGSFRIGGLGEGLVELEVFAPDGLVQAAPTVVPAGTRDVAIELDALVPAVVTVRDPEGRPVKGAAVTAWRVTGAKPVEVEWGRTDDEGRVRLEELARKATHRLVIKPLRDGYGAKRIDDWKPADTQVTLSPESSIAGRAFYPDGTPYDDEVGQIWTWDRARGWERVDVGEGGAFEMGGFGGGRVALLWVAPENDPFEEPEAGPEKLEMPVTWVAADSKDIVFRLPDR